MTDRELMQQALEALEEINKLSIGENAICLPAEIDGAMDALRQALETKREWVGLTEEEINNSYLFWVVDQQDVLGFGKSLETKLKRKNT